MHLQPEIIMNPLNEPNLSMVGYEGHDFYIIVNLTPIQGQLLYFNIDGELKCEYNTPYLIIANMNVPFTSLLSYIYISYCSCNDSVSDANTTRRTATDWF